MKQIVKKRIVLYCPWEDEEIIGTEEYDSSILDEDILNALHEQGRTMWLPTYPDYDELWLMLPDNGIMLPHYKIGVDEFYVQIPTFWDRIKDVLFGRKER